MSFKTEVRLVLMIAVLFSSGCEQSVPTSAPPVSIQPSTSPKSSGSAAVPPMVRPMEATSKPNEPVGETQPAQTEIGTTPPVPTAAQPQPPPTNPSPRIHLTTGVALAQTLPDGTSVLCSMDYQWVAGGPQPGVEYFWVIELGNGQRLTGPANVTKLSGRIQPVLHRVRPDQAPFKGAIFAKNTTAGMPLSAISDFIPLHN